MIALGDRLPEMDLIHASGATGTKISTAELTKGKTLVLFAVPGSFTPTCSAQHLPGFVNLASSIKSKGVDDIAGLAVNDPFVLNAWGRENNVGDEIMMLSDWDAAFTKAIGMEFDLSALGLGLRSQRYAMLVRDGKIAVLNMDKDGVMKVSSAEQMLAEL